MGQLGPTMAKYYQKWPIWGLPETPGTISDGSKGVELVPPDVRCNVQPCSTSAVFNPNGSARPAYDQILSNMAKNGRFLGPPETPRINFGGSKWVKLFNRCSTQIGQLGLSMAKYCQEWPKMAVFGGPLRPQGPFSMGPKGLNWSLYM